MGVTEQTMGSAMEGLDTTTQIVVVAATDLSMSPMPARPEVREAAEAGIVAAPYLPEYGRWAVQAVVAAAVILRQASVVAAATVALEVTAVHEASLVEEALTAAPVVLLNLLQLRQQHLLQLITVCIQQVHLQTANPSEEINLVLAGEQDIVQRLGEQAEQ